MKGFKNFGTILVIASLIASLGLVGCADDADPILCSANSCTPNGTCVVVDGTAVCECNENYKQGEGLTCIRIGDAKVGEACVGDADCADGRCLKYMGDAEGYCTTTNCTIDSECVNHFTTENREMCCVEVDAAYFICLKVAEGYPCGDGTGTCGTSCTGTADSACGIEFPCLRSSDTDPKAICSAPCATDNDCLACEWSVDPDALIECITISGGDKYCLVNESIECNTSTECPDGDTCSIGVSPDMTDLYGECMNVGGLPPGSECNDEDDPNELSYEDRCSGFYCLGGMCSEVCVVDTDCPVDMICEVLRFSNVDDEILVCMGDATCGGPADCADGESCWPTLSGNEMNGWCRPNEGTDPVGTECTDADDTCEVFCMEPLCTEWCTVDEDCPSTMICETINFCIAEPCDHPDNVAPGTVCLKDDSCGAPTDCDDGYSCWPTMTAEGGLDGWCRGNEGPDPVGTECVDDDPETEDIDEDTCEVFCMEPLCTEWCTIDADCPDTMICETINFCLAEPCDHPDNVAPGTVCLKDDSCGNATECDEGYGCWPTLTAEGGLDGWCRADEGPDPVGAACVDDDPATADIDEDTCEVMCMDSLCTEWCTLDTDCPNTMICEAVGFCIAEPCTDPDNIASGTVCIEDNACGAPADCAEGDGCWPTLDAEGALAGWCRENSGADALGTACTMADDTCEVMCIGGETDGLCSEVCTVDADCDAAQDCLTVGLCIAEPCTDPNNVVEVDMCVPAT